MNKQIILNICLINFLLAISTVIGMTIIPLIIIDTLGFSLFTLGIIEGFTEFFASTLRLISGFFFDKQENKFKLLLYPLYLAFISKLILLNPNTLTVVSTKIIERLSNGAFGPIRDALILKMSNHEGQALSFLNISKSFGCLLGPILVVLIQYYTTNITFLISLCLGVCFIALILANRLKKLPITIKSIKTDSFQISKKDLIKMKKILPIIILSCLFFLCRFNDGLIIIFLKDLGYPSWIFLSTIGIFNAFMLIISPIIGKLLDKGFINQCIIFTLFSMILFNFISYNLTTANILLAFLLLFFWGAQRVSSQMTFLYLIKQNISKDYIGRAIGLYALLTGVSILIASFSAGFLAKISFSYVFLYSMLCAIICLIVFIVFLKTNIINTKLIYTKE